MSPRDVWSGILSGPIDGTERIRAVYPEVAFAAGLPVTHRGSRFTGTLVRLEHDVAVIRGQSGAERVFPLTPGAFEVDGRAVTIVRPSVPRPSAPAITASGSLRLDDHRARVARAGRILVEGIHDAELVERVWGDDLRVEGVVVERLDGIDDLAAVVSRFDPGPGRRLGVLVDHLVDGSKEARLAAEITHPDVLVTGTPFIDVWEAVRPEVVGIAAWPTVPIGSDWKLGVCAALGVSDPATMWRRVLASVNSYVDLETALVGAMEQLIDFVTAPG